MKRIITGLTAALALAFVGSARADETQTTTSKTTVKKNTDGTQAVKSEKKTTTDPKGTGNATTDTTTYSKDVDKNSMGGTTTKVEKKSTHDAPGTAMDKTTTSSDTIEKNASGKVVKEEKLGPTTTK